MATAEEFLAMAQSQIGITEYPADSNHVKYGEWYGLDYNPWCDMFVSWCANEVGALDVVGKYAYCPSHVNYAKSIGCWLDREEKPQAGDVIFFANQGTACHTGIVETRNGTSSVTTVEGNTSVTSNDNGGAVMRRTRTYGTVGSSWYILGFFRPPFDGVATGTTGTTSNTSSLDVDGFWGRETTKAVQSALGTEVDGYVSYQYAAYKSSNPGLLSSSWQWFTSPAGHSPMVKALQNKVGAYADGHIGPATIRALQNYLGTGADGCVSSPSPMVKELQRRLNACTF